MTYLKRTLLLILCVIVATTFLIIPASAYSYLLGDADGDDIVTILDATHIQRVLADLTDDDDGMIALRGDTNKDGLDILDATRIQRWLAGYSGFIPVRCDTADETSAPTEAPTQPSTDSEGWGVIIYRP